MRGTQATMVVAFSWLASTNNGWSQGRTDVLELAVRTHVGAGTEMTSLRDALALTRRVFADAGIRVAWTHCGEEATPANCHDAAGANEFIVRILPTRLDAASHVCGTSLRPEAAPGHYITLFLDCIREGADAFGVPEPVVAAFAIAHEIGHLLLPVGHAPSGIMRARPDRFDWQRAARGALQFDSSDQKRMRTELRRRAQPRLRSQISYRVIQGLNCSSFSSRAAITSACRRSA